MLSVAKVQRRNAWRYYVRGVAFGDGRRPVGQSLKDAQEMAGLPPGRWLGRGLVALGLAEGAEVSERQMELVFGQGRHPDADRIERGLLDDGADPATARLATCLGSRSRRSRRASRRRCSPSTSPSGHRSLIVLWALGDAKTRRVVERAHERAIAKALRWLENEVAETRWSSGRGRAKTPALVVAAFRHFDNRDGFPLLHDHCLILKRVQRRGDDAEPVWGALDTFRLYRNVVAAGTLYTLAMTTEVCEELGLATVPREVTPGLRPVMEIAGVDSELIDWSSTRRQRIEDVLEGLTYKYTQEHGRLPGERARHGLGWLAAQDTRPEKKTPRPLEQLLTWWRASALWKFGQQVVDGLLQRCRTVGAAIRVRAEPAVDAALAAVDVAAVVFTVRGTFARRHVLAEARRHLLETLRGQQFTRGLDDYIANRALSHHSRQLTVPRPGRRMPAPDQLTYTADFAGPARWWIAGADGKPPRTATRYERAKVASLAMQNAIRATRTAPAAALTDHHGQAADVRYGANHPRRDAVLTPAQRTIAVNARHQAAMPEEGYLKGRTTDPETWMRTPANLERLAAIARAADSRRRALEDREVPAPAADPVDPRRQEHEEQHPQSRHGRGRDIQP
ncbi:MULTISPECIES: MobF family relaxase [unclassified Streptomyces]|uniref:MobF family relaxase n=1 Tax=unclassified Streptomyces TaxID=2593676 RepID=UPI0036996C97